MVSLLIDDVMRVVVVVLGEVMSWCDDIIRV